jgi:hypothetical protein
MRSIAHIKPHFTASDIKVAYLSLNLAALQTEIIERNQFASFVIVIFDSRELFI